MATLKVKIEQDQYGIELTDWLGGLTNKRPETNHLFFDLYETHRAYYHQFGYRYYVSCNHTTDDYKDYSEDEVNGWVMSDFDRLLKYYEGELWNNTVSVWVQDGKNRIEAEHSVLSGVESDASEDYLIEIVKDMIPDNFDFSSDDILEAIL